MVRVMMVASEMLKGGVPSGAIMGSDASARERDDAGDRREAQEVWPVAIEQGGTGTGVVTADAVVCVVAEALGANQTRPGCWRESP
jgi:uridylate kinase